MSNQYVTQEECNARMSRMYDRVDDILEGFVEVKTDIKWIKRLIAILAILAGKYVFGIDLKDVVLGI